MSTSPEIAARDRALGARRREGSATDQDEAFRLHARAAVLRGDTRDHDAVEPACFTDPAEACPRLRREILSLGGEPDWRPDAPVEGMDPMIAALLAARAPPR